LALLRELRPCTDCEWECFRDPSELVAPLLQLRTQPTELWRHWRRHPQFYRHWLEDLRYARACGWFDGRQGLSSALAAFAASPQGALGSVG
jgi:hypothetical protein